MGLPVSVSIHRSAADVPDGNSAVTRPDVVAGVPMVPAAGQTPQFWINPAAFASPADGLWGNAGRNLVRGPAMWHLEAALSRRFGLTERTQTEFRSEGFNLFNRPQYGLPLADVSAASTFGRITSLVNTGPTGSGTRGNSSWRCARFSDKAAINASPSRRAVQPNAGGFPEAVVLGHNRAAARRNSSSDHSEYCG